MRHYVAVQDPSTGKWFYANEDRHRETGQNGWSPSGACGPFNACPTCKGESFMTNEPCETCDRKGVIRTSTPCQGHNTAAEAYEHERQHRLDRRLRFHEDLANPSTVHRCKAEGCNAFTSGMAEVGSYHHWHLCAEHRTREIVDPLFKVGESWES